MADYNRLDNFLRHDKHMAEAEKKLRDERQRADAEQAYRFANMHMPEDIRSRARAYGMEAWAEVLWNNAFQAGFREAMRNTKEARNG